MSNTDKMLKVRREALEDRRLREERLRREQILGAVGREMCGEPADCDALRFELDRVRPRLSLAKKALVALASMPWPDSEAPYAKLARAAIEEIEGRGSNEGSGSV